MHLIQSEKEGRRKAIILEQGSLSYKQVETADNDFDALLCNHNQHLPQPIYFLSTWQFLAVADHKTEKYGVVADYLNKATLAVRRRYF